MTHCPGLVHAAELTTLSTCELALVWVDCSSSFAVLLLVVVDIVACGVDLAFEGCVRVPSGAMPQKSSKVDQ